MDLIKKLFASQKFIVLLVSAIGLLITKIFKVQVDPATITEFVILIGGYLIGQGIADNGKGAAKVQAIAALATTPFGEGTRTEKAAAVDAIKAV